MAYFLFLQFILLSAISSLAYILGQAVPPPPPTAATTPPSRAAQEFLDEHNKARAEVGVGPLTWSSMLAKETSLLVRYQRDKQNCSFANLSSGKYGGNQLWASGMVVTPRMVVDSWVDEKKFYNYANNSCIGDDKCGVYTQIVWKKSIQLGCAQATCSKGPATLTICFYNPPGNVIGEKPY
ncbi:STS14 protein [Capsicum annuum]|uniref:STS14 protein n=1 Tax=Capsicum annuum TaxID=4072 RepID=A0A1U8FJN9_CAPAN|nr:STS14 protein [Capsicum annuum]XP_047262046.1 STS14 protein-like [Capsicum annuum]PHT89574.1 STS14 protein [Capsicum annuum]